MVSASILPVGTAPSPRPLSTLPTPKGLPLFGNVLDAWRDPIKFLTEGSALGDMVRYRFGEGAYKYTQMIKDTQATLNLAKVIEFALDIIPF